MYSCTISILAGGLTLFMQVHAQAVHVVKVADTGSMYDPMVVSALKGDIVSFQFAGVLHTVTQGNLTNPCVPLQGGFDSGFAGVPLQTVAPVPVWNLTITDATNPIWFFCRATRPSSHCAAGMVGAINPFPTGNQSYATWLAAAKALTNPPELGMATPSLIGVGAAATAAPSPLNAANTTSSFAQSSTSSASSSSTPSQSASSSTSSKSTNVGGIVGGVLGGIVILILLALLFMQCRRARRLRAEAAAHVRPRPFETTPASPPRSKSDMMSQLHYQSSPSVGNLPAPPSPPPLRERSEPSLSDAGGAPAQGEPGSPPLNVRELAAEIASFMRQGADPSSSDSSAKSGGAKIDGAGAAASLPGGQGSAKSPRKLPQVPERTAAEEVKRSESDETLPAYLH